MVCLLCHMWVFCILKFFVSYIISKSFIFLFVPFMSHVGIFLFFINVFYVIRGFFLLSKLSTLPFICVFDIIHVLFFLLILYIGLCVFYVGYGALDLNLLLFSILVSMCILLLFVVILMFKGCESKGWNLELGKWKEIIEACKHHILIHLVINNNLY
jgi:hypothetical protein